MLLGFGVRQPKMRPSSESVAPPRRRGVVSKDPTPPPLPPPCRGGLVMCDGEATLQKKCPRPTLQGSRSRMSRQQGRVGPPGPPLHHLPLLRRRIRRAFMWPPYGATLPSSHLLSRAQRHYRSRRPPQPQVLRHGNSFIINTNNNNNNNRRVRPQYKIRHASYRRRVQLRRRPTYHLSDTRTLHATTMIGATTFLPSRVKRRSCHGVDSLRCRERVESGG
jgi:hypothetical protein